MSTALLESREGLGRPVRNIWARIGLLGVVPALALVAIFVARYDLGFILSAYGFVSVGRVVMQATMAGRVRRRKFVNPFDSVRDMPYVSIQVTAYNENPDLFRRGLQSLKDQNWPKFLYEILVLDDGSDNHREIVKICREFKVRYIRAKHGGKREVMMVGFAERRPETEYILTGDSDTVWDENATLHLVAKMVTDPTLGAATGHVATINEKESWLTRIISVRYWYAFEVERSAQAAYGGVTCVSGPLGIYRAELIDEIKDEWINQTFLGEKCTFGDDRHLTNLILGLGYKVDYVHKAIAWTDAPPKLKRYINQQARWNRSFWREQLWTFKALRKQHIMVAVDWALNLVLPFIFAASIGWYIYQTVIMWPNVEPVVRFFTMLMAMALLRAMPAIAATRQAKFLLMPAFALFHILLLLPLRFYALVTPKATGWGTRLKQEEVATARGVAQVPELINA